MVEYYLYPIFDAPWGHGTPHFLTQTLALGRTLGIVCAIIFLTCSLTRRGQA